MLTKHSTVGKIVEAFDRWPQLIGQIEVLTANGFKKIEGAAQTAVEVPVEVHSANGNVLTCSENHRLWSDGDWKFVKDLDGKTVHTDGKPSVVRIRPSKYGSIPLFDLQVEGEEYYVEGFRSHNSTLPSIFAWTLFGKALKSIPAEGVKNIYTKGGAFAAIEFTKDDDYYEITRYRGDKQHGNGVVVKRNGIVDEAFSNGTLRDVQASINALLGMDYDAFVSSAIFSTEVVFDFPSLTAERRRAHLETILGLSSYSLYGKAAKNHVRTIKRDLDDLVIEVREKKSFLESEKQSLVNYTDLYKNFGETKKQKVADLEVKLRLAEQEVLDFDMNKWGEISQKVSALKEEVERRKEALTDAKFVVERLTSELKSCEAKLAADLKGLDRQSESLTKDYKRDSAELERRKELIQCACPTCKRDWEPTEVESVLADVEEQEAIIKKSYYDAVSLLESERAKITSIAEVEIADIDAQRTDRRLKMASITEKMPELLESLEATQKELGETPGINALSILKMQASGLAKDLELAKAETNPYKGILEELHDKIVGLTEALDKADDKKSQLEDHLKYATFWDESFNSDGLKIFVFESIIPIFNQRLAHYLPILFDGKNVNVEFDKHLNMTTTKDGELLAYGNLSQGERKRVDLAISFALLETAQAQYGMVSNVMFFDEIFDGSLDSSGVKVVSEILHSIPVPTIFVISHRSEVAADFDSVVEIEKEGHISRIVG